MLKKLAFALSLTLVTLALAVPAQAQVIGLPPSPGTGNCFPFGCAFRPGASTRYQQVYHHSNFALPFTITDISFFNTQFLNGGFLNTGTYTFSLSSTTAAVNGLAGPSLAGMNSNLGADNAVFGVFVLTGTQVQPTLTFTQQFGGFFFDPTKELNLLLDIRIPDIAHPAGTTDPTIAFLDTRNNAPATMFSRMHDFGGGFSNRGLVTGFQGGSMMIGVVPEPGTVFLLATGLVGLGMAARRRQKRMSI